MKLFDIQGNILFETGAPTVRRALEQAVRSGIALPGANLRRTRLKGARLDGLQAPGACFWGADLSGCDLADADLSHADCRMATFTDSCLAGACCAGGDYSGAYFRHTLIEGADFCDCRFSCPSFLMLPLELCAALDRAIYWHRGEWPCPLDHGLIRFNTAGHEVVIMGDQVLYNGALCCGVTK